MVLTNLLRVYLMIKLNRSSFSEQLAQAILSYKSKDNLTVGLYGKWGTGKTSIINMVLEVIENETKDDTDKPIIVKFNPWNYSDRTQIISQFFNTLLPAINSKSSNETMKKVGNAMKRYSTLLGYTQYIPLIGKYFEPLKDIVSGAGESLIELSESGTSLEELKENIINGLNKQPQKIIVIIDDIDRLNNEQIRLIFQLVNCVAGFPNMIYLLSFDKDIVVRALSEEQKCDGEDRKRNGEEYLEKIIQVPFEIPGIKDSDINDIFLSQLSELVAEELDDRFDQYYWNNVFNNSIAPFISTLRDVNRIMNVYKFNYGFLHDETNWCDLLAVTTFQVCAPGIYQWLKNNISSITGVSSGGSINQEERYNDYIEQFKECYKNPQIMFNALDAIFPSLSPVRVGAFNTNETNSGLRYAKRIACADRAQIYFRLSLEEIPISSDMIKTSIKSYSSAELDKLFKGLSDREQLQEYLKELEAHIRDIPSERIDMFLNKLVNLQVGSYDIDIDNIEKNPFSVSPEDYCARCRLSIFKSIGKEKTYYELKELIKKVSDSAFPVVVSTIVMIEKAYGRMDINQNDMNCLNYKIITEDNLSEIDELAFNRIKTIAKDKFILSSYKANVVIRFWEYKDEVSLGQHISEKITDATNIPAYLAHCTEVYPIGKICDWDFNKESIEKYISIETAYQKILEIKGTKAFSSLPLNLKRISIAFWMWYNSESKSEQYHDFSESNVDKLIPEWDTSVTVSH